MKIYTIASEIKHHKIKIIGIFDSRPKAEEYIKKTFKNVMKYLVHDFKQKHSWGTEYIYVNEYNLNEGKL